MDEKKNIVNKNISLDKEYNLYYTRVIQVMYF